MIQRYMLGFGFLEIQQSGMSWNPRRPYPPDCIVNSTDSMHAQHRAISNDALVSLNVAINVTVHEKTNHIAVNTNLRYEPK